MPITRFQLRNEYGLGTRDLYREAVEREDPKAVLDGVAVAGLVGVLRQLGDLAEFAADVFHSLQEQVMNTSSRSRKLMSRVKNVEAALPPLEKAILTQTSHIHFAYTPGSEWHAQVASEQNHFIYSDLPRCIMDLYEECKEPPRLQLLDRFDTGGPGTCLKKYSDPTFFRRASGNFSLNAEKSQKDRKSGKIKKRKSTKQGSHNFHDSSSIDYSSRVQFSPSQHRQSSPIQTVSTFDMTFKSDVVDLSDSLGSEDRSGFIECVFHPTTSTKLNEENSILSPYGSKENISRNNEANHTAVVEDNRSRSSISGKSALSTSSVSWDEKLEISEPVLLKTEISVKKQADNRELEFSENEMDQIFQSSVESEMSKMAEQIFENDELQKEHIDWDSNSNEAHKINETDLAVYGAKLEPRVQSLGINEVHVTNNDAEAEPKDHSLLINKMHETTTDCSDTGIQPGGQIPEINEACDVGGGDLQLSKVEPALLESDNEFGETFEGNVKSISYFSEDQHEENESETDNFVDALNTIESESESDLDIQAKKEIESFSNLKGCSKGHMVPAQAEAILLESESPSTSLDNLDRAWLALEYPTSQVSAVEQSLEGASSCNGFGWEQCQNPNDPNFSVYSVVDTAQQGPTTYLSLPPCEEPLQEAASPSDISGEVCQTPDNSVSLNSADNTCLEGMKSSSVQNHPHENDSGVCGNQINASEPESSIDKSKFTTTSKDCVAEPPSGSHQPPFQPHVTTPSTLWTNGCLLGLQPSKPMDSGTSDAMRSNGFTLDTVSCEKYDVPSIGEQPYQPSNSVLDGEQGKLMKLHQSNNFDHSQIQNRPTSNPIPPVTKNSVLPDANSTPNEMLHMDGNRFPLPRFGGGVMSRFRQLRSNGYDEKPKAVDSQKSQSLEKGCEDPLHDSLCTFYSNEPISSVNSPPPSPPLEHVRISFQPISTLETSKLKLNYPEGIDQHEEGIGAFPSFQLVPEPANLHHGVGSDSDDDTFCRSNPYMSEDELGHLSDSNSELWESGDTSERGHHRGYNGLHRISSEESILCPSELAAEANKIPSDYAGSFRTDNNSGETLSSLCALPNMPVFCNPKDDSGSVQTDNNRADTLNSLGTLPKMPVFCNPSDDSGSFQTDKKRGGTFSSLGALPNMPVLCDPCDDSIFFQTDINRGRTLSSLGALPNMPVFCDPCDDSVSFQTDIKRGGKLSSLGALPNMPAFCHPSDDFVSFQKDIKRGGTLSSLGALPNLPVFGNVNPLYQEAKIRPDPKPKESAGSFSLRELTPQTPPLPPIQWRISRSQSALTEADVGDVNNNISLSNDSENHVYVSAFDQLKSAPAERDRQQKSVPVEVDHQQKSASVEVDHQQKSASVEVDHQQKSTPNKFVNKPEGLAFTTKDMFLHGQKLKFSDQEKANQAAKLRAVDEREEFLQQIRTKSFNLRKTGVSRSGYAPPAPSMHVQVTAILEKAKTVRRAVASDGEDGWSDT